MFGTDLRCSFQKATFALVFPLCSIILCGCSNSHELLIAKHSSEDTSLSPKQITYNAPCAIIPFDLVKNLPLLDVYINHHGPYRFLLDTGSTCLMISNKLAYTLNLKTTQTHSVFHTGENTINLGLNRRVKSLEIGKVEFVDLNAAVLDLHNLSHVLDSNIDGVLGAQIFRNCVLTIDYIKHNITISDSQQPSTVVKRDENYLPIRLIDCNIPAIPVKIGGVEYWCVIDSAYSDFLSLPQKAVGNIPLLTPLTLVPSTTTRFYEKIPIKKARINGSVVIGQYEFPEPIIRFQGNIALIGEEILKYFIVTIDQQSMHAHFMKETKEPILPCPAVRHHGFFFRRENTSWIVTDAIDGLSLEKLGLIAGERIESVNGIYVSNLTDEQLKSMVEKNNLLKLKVIREKKIFVDVVVTELIP